MTQESRPTHEHVSNYPDGDSGPYSSAQWRALFSALFTTDPTAQGPIGGHENELEVTNPTGKTIRVASGAGVVNGNIFFNDANIDFTPPTPASSARQDYVVICLNETDLSFSTSDAGYSLTLPDVLTDYGSSASIPAYSCRLAIVRGAEGGGLPTLDQNDDHYMVPLANYSIDTSGTVSSLTDSRELAHIVANFRQRQGGNSVDWAIPGTTNYLPGKTVMQAGTALWTGSATDEGSLTITFPIAFSDSPIVLITPLTAGEEGVYANIYTISGSEAEIRWYSHIYDMTSIDFYWTAIGPE